MTRERRPAGAGKPPDAHGVRTIDELAARLRELRAWSGLSYRTVHRGVLRLRTTRGVPEQPVYNTVYRSFQAGRTRLDIELVVDIAQVLLGEESAAATWRQACRVIEGLASAGQIVDVTADLPAESGEFTGRADELRFLLERRGSTVIDGMAGIGKTRLAVHAAHRLDADVRLAVDLRGFDPDRPPADPGAVLDGFLRCLGVSGELIGRLDLAERTAEYQRALAGQRAVILLDNAATVEQITPLLPNDPECAVLITSRRALDVPAARHVSLPTFSDAEVVEFLRVEQLDIDAADAREFGELVAYLPLALAIVAARIKASPEWTVTDHLDRLNQQRQTLRLDQGVESALALSYQNLPADMRRTFLLLSLHPSGDVDCYAAATLAGISLATVNQHLAHLQTANLLQQNTIGRYAFHDLIRVYATSRAHDELPASAHRAALARLLDYYVSACARAMMQITPTEKRPDIPEPETELPTFDDAHSAAGWFAAERANLVAVAIYADENDRSDVTRMLSRLIGRYLHENGRLEAAQTLHTRSLRTAEGAERSRELSRLGAIAARSGRSTEAVGWFEMALAVAREFDDPAQERRALNGLGNCFWWQGRYDDSLAHHRRALEIAHQLGDRTGAARTLGNIGAVYERLGRYADAVSMFERSLQIARELAERDHQSHALNNLAVMCLRLGRLGDAEAYCKQTIVVSRDAGDRYNELSGLGGLGEVYCRLGRYEEALDFAQRAVSLSREVEDRSGESIQLMVVGGIYRQTGQYDESLRTLRQALEIATEVPLPRTEINIRNLIGLTLFQAGSPAQAIDYHRAALAIEESVNALDQRAQAHHGLGDALSAIGDHARAESHWREALRIYSELGVPEAAEVRTRLGMDSEAAAP